MDVLDQPLSKFYTSQISAQLIESGTAYSTTAVTNEFVPMERELVTRGGDVIKTLLHARPEIDEQGDLFGIRAMYVDVSESKQIEEILMRYTSRLEVLRTIDQTILTGESLEEIAYKAMSYVRQLVACQQASVITFDLELSEATILAVNAGFSTKIIPGQRMALDEFNIDELQRGEHYVTEIIPTSGREMQLQSYGYQEGILSFVVIPLVYQDDLVGCLILGMSKLHSLTAEDVDIAYEVANQLALAIQNRYLFEAAQRRLNELTVLVQSSAAISTSLDIDTALQICVQQVTKSLASDRCLISVWKPNEQSLEILIDYVVNSRFQEDNTRRNASVQSHPLAQSVLLSGQAEQIQIGDPALAPTAIEWLKHHQFDSLLALPLIVRDQIVGLLELRSEDEHIYTSIEIGVGQTLANQMAAALENSKLFEQVQDHAEALEQRVIERTKELQTANQQLEREIVERKQAEEALQKSEEQFRLIFELAPTGIIITTIGGEFLQINQGFCDIVGYSSAELLDKTIEEITHKDDLEPYKNLRERVLAGEMDYFRLEERLIRRDKQIIHVIVRMTLVRETNHQPLHFIGQIEDITERKRAESILYHNAFHDILTGLPNRVLLRERLEMAIERADEEAHYRYAILFIDLDRFKIVNDSLGHLAGDQLLVLVGNRLQACVRSQDLVARLGGDEFAILLDGFDDDREAKDLADRIQEQLAKSMEIDGQTVFITASIGIALNTANYDQPEDLLRDADAAMYQAKAMGKARYAIFEQGAHMDAVARLTLETDLRQAIEREEFELFYQPIVACEDGLITGVETLLRWRHPEHGLIKPKRFLPLLEETRLMVPLGVWVLRMACIQAKAWHSTGFTSLRVAVNISVYQLQQVSLPDLVQDILDETGLNPYYLELEVTESAAIKNMDLGNDVLYQLRDMGVQISIDDFGTGYSS
ncbi:MAG: diguanylate cyclase, partial [Chloroflexota bacterium]